MTSNESVIHDISDPPVGSRFTGRGRASGRTRSFAILSPGGWRAAGARSSIHTAARLKRLPLFLRLIARITSPDFVANRPWSAVCLLARQSSGLRNPAESKK